MIAKAISKLILKLGGYTLIGALPPNVPKFVLIGAPHTSNWDFIFGRAAMYIYGINMRYVIKHSYFEGPFKFIFEATGGIPVNRSKNNNLVDAMVNLFHEMDELALLITPEGTRSRVERWRTGFYHVAVAANVPILLGFLDTTKKEIGFGHLFYPSGDKQKDFMYIQDFYADKKGIVPENFNHKLFN